ncbi:MAG: HPr family phosphocarrier protein [Deltaproteobacteria bacterium]|nr:HPr family phosphocarrier protein [Deltaproteobacteria bacterium]
MYQRTLTVKNQLGFHARAAALFVQLANRFDAEVTVCKDNLETNGKSIMGLLTLAASKGTEVCIKAQGPEAEEALEALTDLVNRGFDED